MRRLQGRARRRITARNKGFSINQLEKQQSPITTPSAMTLDPGTVIVVLLLEWEPEIAILTFSQLINGYLLLNKEGTVHKK